MDCSLLSALLHRHQSEQIPSVGVLGGYGERLFVTGDGGGQVTRSLAREAGGDKLMRWVHVFWSTIRGGKRTQRLTSSVVVECAVDRRLLMVAQLVSLRRQIATAACRAPAGCPGFIDGEGLNRAFAALAT